MVDYLYSFFVLAVFALSFFTYKKLNAANRFADRRENFQMPLFRRLVIPLQVGSLLGALIGIAGVEALSFTYLNNSMAVQFAGVTVTSLGAAIFMLSVAQLGVEYSPCYDARAPRQLVSSGLYRYIRHPIYSGNFLILAGVFMISGSMIVLVAGVVLFGFYYLSAVKEEQILLRQFPTYKRYLKETGRFMPRLINIGR